MVAMESELTFGWKEPILHVGNDGATCSWSHLGCLIVWWSWWMKSSKTLHMHAAVVSSMPHAGYYSMHRTSLCRSQAEGFICHHDWLRIDLDQFRRDVVRLKQQITGFCATYYGYWATIADIRWLYLVMLCWLVLSSMRTSIYSVIMDDCCTTMDINDYAWLSMVMDGY